VITISESSKSELVRHGFLSNNIIVVRPGLNPELYSRYDVEHKPFSKNIIYLGRLKRYKGVIDLLKVFRNLTHFHREARLYIVGKGDLLYELVNLRRRLDLENKVFITGYVREEVKSLLLYKSAVIVYNGKQFDGGWSIACAEGMALGAVPVVSTYLKDMVVESGSGFVFKADNSSQLCNALSRLLEDEKTWRHMSLKGSQWVRSFTWDRTANETFTAIERFLGSSEGRTR
jgi:glycosyltransferase involved in cell wall biosynthesis